MEKVEVCYAVSVGQYQVKNFRKKGPVLQDLQKTDNWKKI